MNNLTKDLGLKVLPVVIVAITAEVLYLRARRGTFPFPELFCSFVIAAGQRLIGLLTHGLTLAILLFVYGHRLFTIEMKTPLHYFGLFLVVEFVYYWFHRLSHEVRWLWATHSVHHSATHLNLSASYRLGWTSFISGAWVFWLALVWLGVHPLPILALMGINLAYQFWLHTETVPPLRGLEYLLNTPSLHRVHHASNPEYLDRNYGGVLMIYDLIFGTFKSERGDISIRYGLAGVRTSLNPIRIAFQEWVWIGRDLWKARTLSAQVHAAFGHPRSALDYEDCDAIDLPQGLRFQRISPKSR
ncbi:MAG: sterol desaturase family protein [Deltaproteobacteria bacterium]|nr:sterol desaturase family protein [Deltaproteobacteria bacterium]MBI3293460.1 sterol desaturase family protein [Deltaproteobacteria bacterium]